MVPNYKAGHPCLIRNVAGFQDAAVARSSTFDREALQRLPFLENRTDNTKMTVAMRTIVAPEGTSSQ